MWTYDLYQTTGKEDLKQVVENALHQECDLFVVCGGDGTVSGVIDGLAKTELPLAILPSGTANVFATALGIPKNTREAFDLIFSDHKIRKVDAIQYQNRFYILEISLGVSAQSIGAISRREKQKMGWLPYIWKGIQKMTGIEPIWFECEIDGHQHHFKAAEVALFNTSQIGVINENLDADVKLDDGVLDFYAIRSKTLWDLVRMLYFRLIGKPRYAPHLNYWQVSKQVTISTSHPIKFQADGDLQGKTPAIFSVAEQVVNIIVPNTEK